jgi:hypothetical protein
MGFSHLLVSSLNSVNYCAFSVGEKIKFRIICGTFTYPVTCPHNSSPPHPPYLLCVPALAKHPFTLPQATDNHSSSHNTILIHGVGTIFIDQYRGYYCYVHYMDIHY